MNHHPELNKTRKHQLTTLQSAKLYVWMESRKAILAESTASELAQKASKDLGFTVGYFSVARLRSEMGYSPREKSNGTMPSLKQDHKIQVLAQSIASLYKQLGCTPSVELDHISRGQ